MNWVRELLGLYEKNRGLVGKVMTGRFGEDVILLPPFHTTVKAHITVRITPEGTFLGATKVAKEDALTVIPVTEKSAARTSSTAAHPLCDNLVYIDGGYNEYAKEKDKNANEKHRLYLEGIKAWAESDCSHEKVVAVYRYVSGEHTIVDLLSAGIFETDENGFIPNIKELSFLRFSVESEWTQDAPPAECWLDETLRNAYIGYTKNLTGNTALSYLTGDVVPISYLQPKKIRNEGDGAKLISSNDSDGYTYRGRFANREEAFAIGYEESQNMHNALKWIIRRQGRSYGELTVVVWESELHPIPDYSDGTDDICDRISCLTGGEGVTDVNGGNERSDAAFAAGFNAAIDEYRKIMGCSSDVMIMALCAATPGRLSVVEISSLPTTSYLDNLECWHRDCGLLHKSKAKDKHAFYGMIGVKDIADMLYGNDRLLPTVCNRLRSCIVFGKPLPEDMVRRALMRASSPLSYESETEWERMLSLACSMVKKKEIEKGNRGEWSMSLNNESRNRSYLYGRLLAVADRIEYRTYEVNEKRQTNAKRYMNAFSQRPFRTWQTIAVRMEPYLQRLQIGESLKYSHLIEEICERFCESDFVDDSPLDGLYLLGFYNQSYYFRNKTEKNTRGGAQ